MFGGLLNLSPKWMFLYSSKPPHDLAANAQSDTFASAKEGINAGKQLGVCRSGQKHRGDNQTVSAYPVLLNLMVLVASFRASYLRSG